MPHKGGDRNIITFRRRLKVGCNYLLKLIKLTK